MKRLKRWLLPMVTVLLIGAGAGMPWAAARVQDLYGIAGQEVWPVNPVSLTLQKDSEIGAVLRLMSDIYDQGEWPYKTKMTEEEACAAALDALGELDRHGLLESGYINLYGYVEEDILDRLKAEGGSGATPLIFISRDGTTAIIWKCYWKGKSVPGYDILVDDATGLAVAGYIPSPHVPTEELYMRMERWRAFFRDYYELEITLIKDQSYDDLPRFLFIINPGDGLGELGIMVRMFYFEMDFSPWLEEDEPPPAVLPEDGNVSSQEVYYDRNSALLPK